MVKVNGNKPVLVFYDTLVYINSVATEKRNLEIMKVKLTDLLYLIIVHAFVFAYNIININMYTTILMCFSYLDVWCKTCIHLYHTLDISQQ
jgi:hypothetical protein